MTPAQALEGALPFIAMLISYGIQQAHFRDGVNTFIAILTIVAAALATVFLNGQLTRDIMGDFLLVLAASTALQSRALSPLQRYLLLNFPLTQAAAQTEDRAPAPDPQLIVLPESNAKSQGSALPIDGQNGNGK